VPRFAANLSLLFTERPMLERFAAARTAGFGAVEIQFPYEHDPRQLAAAAFDANVEVVLINAPVIESHRFGLACVPELRDAFRSGLDRLAEYAQALGVCRVNLLAGQAGVDDSTARVTLVDHLLLAAERLDGIARVLLEPINALDVPNYLVDGFELAREVIADCEDRVGLQFDVYHAARMGLDPLSELATNLALVGHVQFADAPGRHEPGTGRIEFEPLWTLLDDAGYSGFVSAEYHPSGDTRSSLGWLERWRTGLVNAPESG